MIEDAKVTTFGVIFRIIDQSAFPREKVFRKNLKIVKKSEKYFQKHFSKFLSHERIQTCSFMLWSIQARINLLRSYIVSFVRRQFIFVP